MIKHLTDEQKSYYYRGGYFKEYVFEFPEIGLTLTNDDIEQESVTIKESIIDGTEFSLGGCIASSIGFNILSSVTEDLSGLLFYARLNIKYTDVSIPMGTYRVDSAKTKDDLDGKEIIAYDALYDISVDVSDWYNDLFKDNNKVSVKSFRESLLTKIGIPFEKQNLINDDVLLVEKTVEAQSGLLGIELLRMISVINGGFGKMDRYGFFRIDTARSLVLYPEETLYPSDDLYPEDSVSYIGSGNETGYYPEYYSVLSEEYVTQKITSVNIQTESSDVAVASEENQENPYLITGNILLYKKNSQELKSIGHAIYSTISDIQYRPCTIDTDGIPYMETGDSFALMKNGKAIESIVFTRTLKGIQALRDTFDVQGSEYRENNVSISEQIKTLNGKALRISQDVNGVSQEVSDLATETSTRFEQTDSQIVLKVDSQGNLAEVMLGADADNGTVFKVKSGNISMTAEQAISLMAGGNIDLKGKNITITSDNFTVDANGNAYFGGQLNGASGTFSGSLSAINGRIQFNSVVSIPYINCLGLIKGLYGEFDTLDSSSVNSDGNLELNSGGGYGVVVGQNGYFRPSSDNSVSLGSPNYKWDKIYCTSSTISTSDIMEKKNIEDISEEQAISIIDGLKPSWFQFIKGHGRTHSGLIAQDVELLLKSIGIDNKDFAALCISDDEKSEGRKIYGLRYEEFIAIIIKYCQSLRKENENLRDRISKLEREVFKS